MVKPLKAGAPVRYRLAVLSRIVAAAAGGYSLAALSTACLVLGLPLSRGEAVLAATLPAFVILCLAVIWAFAARTAWRAWCGLLIPCALLGACKLWLSGAAL